MLKIFLANTNLNNPDQFLSNLNTFITVDVASKNLDSKILVDDRMKANYIVYILNQNCDFGTIANYIEDSCKRGKRILSCIVTDDFSMSVSDIHSDKLEQLENRLRDSLGHASMVAKNNGARHFNFVSDLIEFLNQAYQILEENKNELHS